MVKKAIRVFLLVELVIIALSLFSFSFFINAQVAFLSSFLVILGASYSYKRMIKGRVESGIYEEKRDTLDVIEDPYELWDESNINDAPPDELDLKQIVKEEKSKIKTLSPTSIKHGLKGGFTPFRIIPYVLLVLGFIALKNNELLDLYVYLPSLFIGIAAGGIFSKDIFI